MLALALRLVSYRVSVALGAAVIALAIAALSGSWWAFGYFYVLCEIICSIVTAVVEREDGAMSVLAHLALSVVWVFWLFIMLPDLVMRVWPSP